MKKIFWATALIFSLWKPVCATWDTSTPAGTEAKSLGDDRIREFKTDIQTALNYEGSFPSTDTANPSFIYTPSSGTTAQRPTGAFAPAGRIYINISSGCIEQYSGTSWNCISVVPSSGIGITQISTTIAGQGLVGGGGSALDVNVDTRALAIVTDSVTIAVGGVQTVNIASGAVTYGTLASNLLPKFFYYSTTTYTNVTGNSGTFVVAASSKVVDTHNAFNGTIFTSPVTGLYYLTVGALITDTSATTPSCEFNILNLDSPAWEAQQGGREQDNFTTDMYLRTSGPIYLPAGNRVSVQLLCGGAAGNTYDVSGDLTTYNLPTFFSGFLIP